jgi:hypothetical protein
MRKKLLLITLSAVLFTAFTQISTVKKYKGKKVIYNLPQANAIPTVTKTIEPFDIVYTPTMNNSFIAFREALAFKESQGQYDRVNDLGYLGKYQFGKTTLNRLKIYDTMEFLKTPELQEDAFIALCSLNKWILIRDIKRSVGKKINGVPITESGILAAAHLAGAGNVKKYLRSNGDDIFEDAFGTNVQHYMKKFAGYNVTFIKPVKNATI